MSFFHFSQNNSGGNFHFEVERGITHHVVIEAPNAQAANVEAIHKGLYFDGCVSGVDCSCCGDRWYRVDGRDSEAQPMVYGQPVAELDGFFCWMEPGREVAVHHADGRIEWFGVAQKVAA
jgi:hypothetical protein